MWEKMDLKRDANISIITLSSAHLKQYNEYLILKHLRNATIALYLSTLQIFFFVSKNSVMPHMTISSMPADIFWIFRIEDFRSR